MTTGKIFGILGLLIVIAGTQSAIASPLEGNILELLDQVSIQWLEDPDGELTIEELGSPDIQSRFKPFNQSSFNYGITRSTFWFKLTLPASLLNGFSQLEITNPFIDLVRLYQPDAIEKTPPQQAGDSMPFSDRPIPSRTLVFNLVDYPSTPEYMNLLLQVKSGGNLHFLMNLWSEQGYINRSSTFDTLLGIYFGMVLIMAIYNLSLFIKVREMSYLYYVIYISCLAMFIACINGLGFKYLWPTNYHWAQISTLTCGGLVVFTAFTFTRNFLQTSVNVPRVDKFLLFFMGLAAAQVIASSMREIPLATVALIVLGISLAPAVWFAGIVCWRSGYRPARFFVIGWSIFLVSVFINGLTHAGIVPATLLTSYAMHIGSAFEVFLLSFALADRMAILKKQKEDIQNIYLLELASTNERLEKLVASKTEALNQSVEKAEKNAQQLSAANQQLQELAHHDGLTRLLNHQGFMEQFRRLIEDARRYEYYISLLLMDLDNFKQINDRFGHLAGNDVLVAFAEILKRETRESDIAARFGGEEFVIVLSRATAVEAMEKAEKIRSLTQQLELDKTGEQICTVSIGITTFDWRDKQSSLDTILQQADEAMYKAKREGKNRISTSEKAYKIISGK